jgi:xylan 1,4-beta-xylosidase
LYRLQIHRTGFRANDAYSAYIEMGAPKDLDPVQLAKLNALTADRPEDDKTVRSGKDGSLEVNLPMRSNDIVLVTLVPVPANGK